MLTISFTTYATIHSIKQDGTGDYSTIQAGINAAVTGDTVLVWPGTYFENIDYNSKSITVASLYLTTQDENYIKSTIIDGGMNGSCVVVSNCTENFTTLCGFTLQHGSGNTINLAGGGIFIEESNISIINCIIKDCLSRIGGGISCLNSDVQLFGTTITNNAALRKTGGIIIAQDSYFSFDTLNKSSVYLNYGPKGGSDISRTTSEEPQHIVLDTATVLLPDFHFISATDDYGYPIYNNITLEIENGKIDQVNSNLYVSPDGNNANSGLNPDEPLQSLTYAIKKILPDTNNPKAIFLSDGIYSPSSNDEIFPVTTRSYVSILGTDVENTIIDAEYIYPLFNSWVLTKSLNIENLTFMRGVDSQAVNSGNGGLDIIDNDSILLSNLIVKLCESDFRAGINSNYSNIKINDLKIYDNIGGNPLIIGNSGEIPKEILVTNTIIENNGPSETIDDGFGGSIGFYGSYSNPNATKGLIINSRISNNTVTFQPNTYNFGISSLSCVLHASVDVVNTTIGNNIVTNPVNSAQVYATEGAEINFYNSIIYGEEDYEIFLGDGQPTSFISTVNVSHSNVKGGEENVQNWNNIHNLNWLEGNIDEDPMWAGGEEPYSYELQPGSPCINTGTPMYEDGMDYPYIKEEQGKFVLYTIEGDTITLPETDLAGNPRISGGRIDMGAYEWQDTTTQIHPDSYRDQKTKFHVYPNPFKFNTFISISTSHEHKLLLEVIDMSGYRVRTIADNRFPAGEYRLRWDGNNDEGFAVEHGNYLVCLYLDRNLVECEKVIRKL